MRSPEHFQRSRHRESQSMLRSVEALETAVSERCRVDGCDCRRFVISGINAVDICKTCGHRDFDHEE